MALGLQFLTHFPSFSAQHFLNSVMDALLFSTLTPPTNLLHTNSSDEISVLCETAFGQILFSRHKEIFCYDLFLLSPQNIEDS